MADPESASTDLANFPALMAQRAQLVECLLCNKKVPEVFAVTAEDIQREKPPFWGIRVCSNCLARLRADARLESNYHSRRAVLELSLFVPLGLAALIGVSLATSALLGVSTIVGLRTWFLIGASTALTCVKIVWSRVGARYGYTHNLVWSVTSRDVVAGMSLVLSGALLMSLAPLLL